MKITKKTKDLLLDAAPETGVILGTMAGYYLLDIPVWALGLIALVVLAGKIYFKSLKK